MTKISSFRTYVARAGIQFRFNTKSRDSCLRRNDGGAVIVPRTYVILNKPLRLVAPYPAGGPADTLARVVAAGLSTRLSRQVVVDNRGGAGGTIGVDLVVKSPPDGYTLLFGNAGPVAVNPSLYTRLKLDPVRDLAAITQLTSSHLILVTHPTAPFKSVQELIAAARSQPDKFTFASSGSGNASHLAGELHMISCMAASVERSDETALKEAI